MILDIIILAFILLLGFIYRQKGLVLAIFEFISIFIALAVAVLFYPVVAAMINTTSFDENIIWGISSFISNLDFSDQLQAASAELSNQMDGAAIFIEHFFRNIDRQLTIGVSHSADSIALVLTNFIINSISFLIVFIFAKMALFIIKGILHMITSLPIINFTNKLGGFILGIFFGICWIWIFCLVIPLIATSPSFEPFMAIFNESILTQWLCYNNLILTFLSSFL